MRVVIIEDEVAASKRLKTMIEKIMPGVRIDAIIDSICDAVSFLSTHEEPDIIFADIHLSDGICFDIFRQVKPRCAVIFTTAYDEYAVEAFKVNAIDYLLKPLHPEELQKSIDKYHDMKTSFGVSSHQKLQNLLTLLDQGEAAFKTRFLVKSGQTMKPVLSDDIAYFIIESQLVFLTDHGGKRYLVEHTLDDLEKKLDPTRFFRINRQMIVALQSVAAIHPYFNSRLKLDLSPEPDADVLVSRMKVNEFKKWLDQ